MDIEESGHTDVASAKNQVKIAMSALEKMRAELTKLDDEGSLPSWWTNKVAIAVDKLDGMADYLDTQVEEVELDEKAKYTRKLMKDKSVVDYVKSQQEKNRKRGNTPQDGAVYHGSNWVGIAADAIDMNKMSLSKKKAFDWDSEYEAVAKKLGEEVEIDELVIQARDVRNRLRGVKFDIKDPDDKDGPFVITVAKKDLEKSKNAMRTHPEYKNKNIKVVSEENEMNESKDDFEPHMMYDPKTGKGYKADTYEDHIRMQKMGYVHEKPKVDEMIQRVANAISFYEAKSSTGYELYHKDFSSAMQHAYAFAKKKYGITIDPKEIDDKVATGPKKPSKDKTNKYRLKGDKGTVQIQVANLDNKRFELNMYKEELDAEDEPKVKEIIKKLKGASKAHAGQASDLEKAVKEELKLDEAKYEYDGKVVKISKKEFRKVHKDYKNSTKGKERMMILDPKTQGSISVPVQFEEVELDEVDEVDESVQSVANAISFSEAKRMSPAARARRDALRDIGGRGKDDEDEVKATDADREKADRNIINKLKKAADVRGNYEIKFDKGPSKKIPFKLLTLVLKKLDRMKPADKLKFQKQAEKSYADFLKAVKDIAR